MFAVDYNHHGTWQIYYNTMDMQRCIISFEIIRIQYNTYTRASIVIRRAEIRFRAVFFFSKPQRLVPINFNAFLVPFVEIYLPTTYYTHYYILQLIDFHNNY